MARALVFALLAVPGLASAQAVYLGAHPVDLDGHWHEAGTPHTHDGLVVGAAPFGEVEGVRVFLADPIAYGYQGTVWTYRGSHPVPGVEAYCSIVGEHAHAFAPDGAFRRDDDGVHVHVGALRGGRAMLRPARMAPDEPIVRPGPALGPFWFGGCLQRFDATGQPFALYGCRPVRRFPIARSRGYGGPSARPRRAPRAPATASPPPRRGPRFPTRPLGGRQAPPSRRGQ